MKIMNLKRFGSVALAGAMAMSMAVPAFAANQSVVVSGSYTPIDLRVVVPTTGTAIINPYGLPIQIGDATISGQQITTSAPLVIQNRSAVALSVSASLSATTSTGVTLEPASASTDYTTATDKKLHVVFEAFTSELDANTATDNDTLRPLFAALNSDDAALSGDVTTTAADATGSLVLREANDGEAQRGGVALFRLSGEAAKKATWEATDTFEATIAFTFEPGEYSPSAGAFELATTSLSMSGTDRTPLVFTPALPDGVTGTPVFTSSDEAVVKIVDVSGVETVRAYSAGTATLTATITGSDGVTYTSTVDITVAS